MKLIRESKFFILGLLLPLGAFLFLPSVLLGEETAYPPVVINEIGAYEATDHEWVEIFVTSAEPVDLTNWKFYEESTKHGLTLYQGGSAVLAPGEYAIIADEAETFLADHPGFNGKIFDSSWSTLREDGEEIGLVDQMGNFREKFVYLPCPDFSLERANPFLADYSATNWQEHASGNTAGQVNSNFIAAEIDDQPPEEASNLQKNLVINLSWQGSISEDVVGYRLEVVSADSQKTIDVGLTTSYQLSDIIYGQDYNFLVRAYDQAGNESEPVEVDLTGILTCPECVAEICPEVQCPACPEAESCPEMTCPDCPDGEACPPVAECSSESCPASDCPTCPQGPICPESTECPSCPECPASPEPTECICPSCPTCSSCPVGESHECPRCEICSTCPVSVDDSSASSESSEDKDDQTTEESATYQVGDVVINEFVSDPVDGEEEWVELYNKTAADLNLAGWTLTEGSGSSTALTGILEANDFLVFKPKGSLNNGGDIIILKDPSKKIIDQVTYGDWDDGNKADNAPVAKDPDSVARIIDGQDTNDDSKDWRVTTRVTKGESNVIAEPVVSTSTTTVIYSSSSYTGSSASNAVTYSNKIIINEFLPNPEGSDTDTEWIELKNLGDSAVDLAGWRLSDSTARKYTIKTDDYPTTFIQAGQFFILYKNKTGISLNNSNGDQVRLFDPVHDDPVDEIQYLETAEENLAYARNNEGEWSWTSTLTPGAENILTSGNQDGNQDEDEDKKISDSVKKSKSANNGELGSAQAAKTTNQLSVDQANEPAELINTIRQGQLIITEIMPDPKGSDNSEWIEILNLGERINLKGCQLDDQEGGSKPYEIKEDLFLDAHEYYVFYREATKLALNNSSDSARLFCNNQLISEIAYEETEAGASYAIDENSEWYWTSVVTPGGDNVFRETNKDEDENEDENKGGSTSAKNKVVHETDLIGARALALGEKVKVQGVVAVAPGILGSQIFYLSGSGMQVYMYKKDFPEMQVGDKVEVSGELAESNGERRIKVKEKIDIQVIEHGSAPEPHEVEVSSINEDVEGYLIAMTGQVIEKKGSTIYLDDGVDEIPVYIKQNTNIDKKEITEGEELKIIGIVSRNKDGYQVMPRSQADIEVVSQANKPQVLGEEYVDEDENEDRTMSKYLWVGLGFVLVALAVVGWKKRKLLLKAMGWEND